MTRLLHAFALSACVLSTTCAPIPLPRVLPAARRSPHTGYAGPTYAANDMWLCRPDLPADQRRVDLASFAFNTVMGLHVLDLQFSQDELIDLIGRRAAALP